MSNPNKSMEHFEGLYPVSLKTAEELEVSQLFQRDMSGISFGNLTTSSRGDGYDLWGLRKYEPGEDYRRIDPRSSARRPDKNPVVKVYSEDITPNLWLVSDVADQEYTYSASGHFSLRDLGHSILCLFADKATSEDIQLQYVLNNDREFRSSRQDGLRSASATHIRETFEDLKSSNRVYNPEGKTRLSDSLQYLADLSLSRHLIVVASSFSGAPKLLDSWSEHLAYLRQQNAIIAIDLSSPSDHSLPESIETFGSISDGTKQNLSLALYSPKDIKRIRQKYREIAEERSERKAQAFRKLEIPQIQLSSFSRSWFTDLKRGLEGVE